MRVRGELTELRADDLRFTVEESAALLSTVSETELDPQDGCGGLGAVGGLGGRPPAGRPDLAGRALATAPPPASALTPGICSTTSPRRCSRAWRRNSVTCWCGPPRWSSCPVRCATPLSTSRGRPRSWRSWSGPTSLSSRSTRSASGIAVTDCSETRCSGSPRLRPRPVRRDVLRRAARWFEEHDRIDDAVRHLLGAGDVEAAAELLMTAQLVWFLERGWAATFLALGERLPEAAIGPQLALNLAYAADISGHGDRVVHWLDVCDQQIDERHRSQREVAKRARRSPGHAAVRWARPRPSPHWPWRCASRRSPWRRPPATRGTRMRWPRWVAPTGSTVGSRRGLGSWPTAGAERGKLAWSTELESSGGQPARASSCSRWAARTSSTATSLEAGAAADGAERDWGAAAAAPVVTLVRLVQGRRCYQRGDLVLGARSAGGGPGPRRARRPVRRTSCLRPGLPRRPRAGHRPIVQTPRRRWCGRGRSSTTTR